MVLVVNGVLLQALPYEDPERLVVVTGTYENGGEVQDWPISQTDFEDWREQNRSFESLAVYTPDPLAYNLLGEGEPERLTGELVSQEYFRILGLEPELGRFFTPEEDSEPFGHAVAVLSYGFWADRFGRDPGVIGETLRLNGTPYQVVEAALAAHPSVRQAAVIVRTASHDDGGSGEKRLAAFLIAAGRTAPSVVDLRAYLRQRLPAYMVPAEITRVPELPLTANGKVDRRALLAAPSDQGSGGAAGGEMLKTEAERLLAEIWQQVLGCRDVRADDRFSELGGHSLSTLRMLSAVRAQFGRQLSVADALRDPTLRQLAAVLAASPHPSTTGRWSSFREAIHASSLSISSIRSAVASFATRSWPGVSGVTSPCMPSRLPRQPPLRTPSTSWARSISTSSSRTGGAGPSGSADGRSAASWRSRSPGRRPGRGRSWTRRSCSTRAPRLRTRPHRFHPPRWQEAFLADLVRIHGAPQDLGTDLQPKAASLSERLERAMEWGLLPREAGRSRIEAAFEIFRRHVALADSYMPQPYFGAAALIETRSAVRHGWNGWLRADVPRMAASCHHYEFLRRPQVGAVAEFLLHLFQLRPSRVGR